MGLIGWSVQDRRRRLVRRHQLASTALDDGVEPDEAVRRLARGLVGLHATDPVSVYLQARARLPGVSVQDIERALYDTRVVARVLAMRRTMFLVDPADMPVLRAAVTDTLADRELRRTATWIEEAGLAPDGADWVRAAANDTLAALAEHGPMTALELRKVVPDLAEQIVVSPGRAYEAKVGMSTRVLFWLATTGEITRGRPGGTIASTSWQWVRTQDWLGPDPLAGADPLDSARDLASRYLAAFGPATFDDLQWWTGWTKTLTRQALAQVRPDRVTVADGLGGDAEALVLPGDGDPDSDAPDASSPAVVLLPALDPTPMGWKARSWYLGSHTTFPGPMFDRNGNIGPTIWVDGRVVGAWAQCRDGQVAWRLLTDHGIVDEQAIADQAAAVQDWLGDVRFTPRFPTPWQQELVDG